MTGGEINWRVLTPLGCLAAAIVLTGGLTSSCGGNPEVGAADAGAAEDATAMGPEDAAAWADALRVGATDGGIGLSATAVDFAAVSCGTASAKSSLTLTNLGATPLIMTATTSGAPFGVAPGVLTLAAGASSTLDVTASVPTSATAGVPLVGSLSLSTGGQGQPPLLVPLAVTPSGAALAFAPGEQTTLAFPFTEVGYPAQLGLTLVNAGNSAATFALGAPTDSRFTLVGDAGATLGAGDTWRITAAFTAEDSTTVLASSTIGVAGVTCGASLQQLTYSARGTTGQLAGWPAAIDFGPADCGGAPPTERSFQLTNSALVDAHITQVALSGAPGFATSAEVGRAIFAGGGTLDVTVDAPAVPAPSLSAPITATLTIGTDAEASPHDITLAVEPNGAILAFDTSASAGFGSFGQVPLLGSASQAFGVVNTGSGAAQVTLVAAPSPAFSVSTPAFAINGSGSQAEVVTFAPVTGGGAAGSIALTATGPLCGPLPAPIPLSGTSGPVPGVSSTSLSFGAICGGASPSAQSFVVTNGGNGEMTWSMGSVEGAGAAQYSVSATPPPGVLAPGATAVVTVSAASVPSPAPSVAASAYAAQIVVTTDVPLDPPHVVSLGETPLGDQLSWGTGQLRFGQVPVGTTLGQPFAVTNLANVGSPAASLTFVVEGAGASAYSVVGGGMGISAGEKLVFAPSSPIAYSAALGITTADALCTSLPAPLPITATGTQAQVALSSTTLAFGTDPSDPDGLVDCGAAGLPQTVTVFNVGNQSFHLTGLALGEGTSSVFSLSGAGATLPVSVPIGGSVDILVTPSPIPQSVANPDDASPFSDTMTITTDAPLDAPHLVSLVMQARGAVIASTPLATSWAFGTAPFGSIATMTTTITNTGNAAASVTLQGLGLPGVFGLRNNPTSVAASGATPIVAQFDPSSADGSWSDVGILSVTPATVFCQPLPPQWTNPTIALAGSSK